MGKIIGHLLRASTTRFVVGCRVSEMESPAFGSLIRVPLLVGTEIYGLIYDMHIDDDGLVRQLVTAEDIDPSVIADNRINRNVPLEISVLAVGYNQDGRIHHLLPTRPPLSLDVIYKCTDEQLREFTTGRFGYFRHILRAKDLPVDELLAAHLRDAHKANAESGNSEWIHVATQELIVLLRDDYPTLMSVLSALSDIQIPREKVT